MTAALNLANLANNVSASGQLNLAIGASNVLPLANGGLGTALTTPLTPNRYLSTGSTGAGLTLSAVEGVTVGSHTATGANSMIGYVLTSNGLGGATWQIPPGASGAGAIGLEIPSINWTVTTAGTQDFTSGLLGFYTAAADMEVTFNGITLVPADDYTFANNTLTIIPVTRVDDNISVTPAFSAGTTIPSYNMVATASGANMIFNSDLFVLYQKADEMEVLINGVTLIPYEDYMLLGTDLTIIGYVNAGDEVAVAPSATGGTTTVPAWTTLASIPIGGLVVGTAATQQTPGALFTGVLTVFPTGTTASRTWLCLGNLAATGGTALFMRTA